jgi:hypothetical protein
VVAKRQPSVKLKAWSAASYEHAAVNRVRRFATAKLEVSGRSAYGKECVNEASGVPSVLGPIDQFLLNMTNRVATSLQERSGLTMPMMLRQVATATIVATFLAIVSTALMRGPVYIAITLVFGGITIASFWKLLQRYSRDAEKDWSSDLARDYMVRAIGATEGQRRMREIGMFFSVIATLMCLFVIQIRPFDLVDLTMLALILSTMAHMYLCCAEPRPPGSRRREFKLAVQTSR